MGPVDTLLGVANPGISMKGTETNYDLFTTLPSGEFSELMNYK